MELALGYGIPALIDVIDVCVSKHQSAPISGDGDSPSEHPKVEDLRMDL